ncbi:MAG: MogA/MoaB family molybdenum cofactor biosynthesis protein [Eggerthellaceae bacterium]|nr:MogA/MoaB family molybdenum cofactor biosynthesis protein [Eggerthellaceae bacterium]
MPELVFAIVTASDTRDIASDTAGAALEAMIKEKNWDCISRIVVPDERPLIADAIANAAEDPAVDIVLTCGGSGLSLRDVTPEATADVCDRYVPGIAEAMRASSLRYTPNAMLSRAVCMQRGQTLVINLPGSEKAATENFSAVIDVLPHAAKMMNGEGHNN